MRRGFGTFLSNMDEIDMKTDEIQHEPESRHTTDYQENLSNTIRPYYEQQRPVVLRGAISTFPALDKWQSWDYLEATLSSEKSTNQVTGAVEIGGSYGSTNSERAEISVLDYIQYLKFFEEKHGRQGPEDAFALPTDISKDELVYMAQNDLFPCLYKDIEIPSFCNQDEENENKDKYAVGLGRLYSVMLWLGPRGCTSPLHYDPLDNVLMQIQGRKMIILYAPNNNKNQSGERRQWMALWRS